MRRILRYTSMAVVLAVLSSSIQGCYTYIPAMSRESDGIYYTASKDADRADRARYYAQQDAYYDDGYYYDDEYYDDDNEPYYMTPVEQAYWSTMPAKYREGGEVNILNTYYVDYDPTIPKVSLALGYGFGAYSPWWGFNIILGNPAYFYEPYWMWPYNYYAYTYPWGSWWGYDPWAWYGPLYRPGPWGWGWSWGHPYWHDPWWWHHGYLPNRPGGGRPIPPADRPPRRYSGDTSPSYDRRPGTGLERPGGTSGGIRNPSDGNRPSQGTSTSVEGYKRRSSGSSGSSIRVPGQSSPSGSRGESSSSSIRNGQRSGYQNIRGGSSSSSSSRSSSGSSSRSYSRPSASSSRSESSPWHYESPTSSREYNSPSSSRSYDMPSSSRSYSSPSSSGAGSGSSSRGTSSSGFSRR